jgi:hypothetical protein
MRKTSLRNTIATVAITAALALMTAIRANAQLVWPGDVNNNGIISAVDLLYLGFAYGAGGPERTGATTDWEAQPITSLWAQVFPDGVNYAYADANGDGFVDEDDLDDALEPNFNLTHGTQAPDGYANAATGSTAPRLRLASSATIVEPGAAFTVDLLVGDGLLPVADFYGLALKISFDANLVRDDSGFEFEESETSWINADNNDLLKLSEEDEDTGQAWVAVTRTNQQGINGSGKIGEFSIFIEDIIVGLEIDTLNIRIDSVRLMGAQFATIPAHPDTARIIVTRDSALVVKTRQQPAAPGASIQAHPNPSADGLFWLQAPANIVAMRLVDALGRLTPIHWHAQGEGQYLVNAQTAPPGLYQLRADAEDGTYFTTSIYFSTNQHN